MYALFLDLIQSLVVDELERYVIIMYQVIIVLGEVKE